MELVTEELRKLGMYVVVGEVRTSSERRDGSWSGFKSKSVLLAARDFDHAYTAAPDALCLHESHRQTEARVKSITPFKGADSEQRDVVFPLT